MLSPHSTAVGRRGDRVKRREFVALRSGAAAAWVLAARAQQGERIRRVEGQVRLLAFAQGLQQVGWAVGSNLRIDTRWGAGDA